MNRRHRREAPDIHVKTIRTNGWYVRGRGSTEPDTTPSRWALVEEEGASEDEGDDADRLNSSVVTESKMAIAASPEASSEVNTAEL